MKILPGWSACLLCLRFRRRSFGAMVDTPLRLARRSFSVGGCSAKRRIRLSLTNFLYIAVLSISPALAQEGRETVAPPVELPALPAADAPAAAVQALPAQTPPPALAPSSSSGRPAYFPPLPPSRPCTERDLTDLWRLVQLYETPLGLETSGYEGQPFQYYFFGENSTYRTYRHDKNAAEQVVRDMMRKARVTALHQFVLHPTGILFFYKDGVYTESLACFIVANARENFKPGQMLLMPPAPPEGQVAAARWVKVYQKAAPKPKPRSRRRR